jgi:hypothetical protein
LSDIEVWVKCTSIATCVVGASMSELVNCSNKS